MSTNALHVGVAVLGTTVALAVSPVVLLLLRMGLGQVYNVLYRYRRLARNLKAVPSAPFLGSAYVSEHVHIQANEVLKFALKENVPCAFRDIAGVIASVSIVDPEMAKVVLVTENMPKSDFYPIVADMWGNGTTGIVSMQHDRSQHNEPWRWHRHVAEQAFRLSSLRNLQHHFKGGAERFANFLLKMARADKPVDFEKEIVKVTLDLIALTGFDYDLGTSTQGTSVYQNRVASSIMTMVNAIGNVFLLLPYGAQVLRRTWYQQSASVVDKLIADVVEQRMKERDEGQRTGEAKDLLDMILNAAAAESSDGRTMTRQQIRAHLFEFFVAGTETTAMTLSFCMYLLATHPDVERRLFEEVCEVMGGPDGTVLAPTADQVQEMKYMTQVLNETLRLYPPVSQMSRSFSSDFDWGDIHIPKGFTAEVNIYGIHHHPKLWPEPDRFDPDRFAPGAFPDRHPCAFLPFTLGPRRCLGMNFFYQEAKTILATIIRSLSFSLVADERNGQIDSTTGLMHPVLVRLRFAERAH